jgi:hypothetical protein
VVRTFPPDFTVQRYTKVGFTVHRVSPHAFLTQRRRENSRLLFLSTPASGGQREAPPSVFSSVGKNGGGSTAYCPLFTDNCNKIVAAVSNSTIFYIFVFHKI